MAYSSKAKITDNVKNVRRNIQSFYEPIQMPGGYTYDHVKTLQTIDLYYNSKYKTGAYDNLGLRKFFYNIVKPTCDIATKFIDLDTKDIILVPEGEGDELPTWIMQKKLKQWLKDTDFGVILNQITFNLPKYGTVVVKKNSKANSPLSLVNLQNLRMDTKAASLAKSSFVYELLSMDYAEVDAMDWENKQDLFDRGVDEDYLIYECYEKEKGKWRRTIYGDLFSTVTSKGTLNRSVESEINDRDDYAGACILDSRIVKELPYREVHWEKVPGRWLGYGFVEYLEEDQVATNEAENLERKGLIFTSLKLYQTRDEKIGGSNILSGSQNGDILRVDSEITPLAMEERNLGAFNNTRNNWRQGTERKTFTSDITTGASLPSRTPLGVANLQASFASSYFELKRENVGLFLKEVLVKDVIPDFKYQNRKQHTLMFAQSDKDIERYDSFVAKTLVDDASVSYALKHGFFPSQQEREEQKQKIKEKMQSTKNRYAEVPKDFYTNVSYYVDILITGENADNGTKSQVIQLALQMIGTNPAILQDPSSRSLFTALLSLGGISPVEIGLFDPAPPQNPVQNQPQQPPQVAGSMAKPQVMSGPMNTTTQV